MNLNTIRAHAETIRTYAGTEFGYTVKNPTFFSYFVVKYSISRFSNLETSWKDVVHEFESSNNYPEFFSLAARICGYTAVGGLIIGTSNIIAAAGALYEGDKEEAARLFGRGTLELFNFASVLIIADIAITIFDLANKGALARWTSPAPAAAPVAAPAAAPAAAAPVDANNKNVPAAPVVPNHKRHVNGLVELFTKKAAEAKAAEAKK